MNLRLRAEAEQALRSEAVRSHRSQQDVLRAAVDRYLGLAEGGLVHGPEELLTRGNLRPPRTPYRKVVPAADTVSEIPSLTLLDRDDRI